MGKKVKERPPQAAGGEAMTNPKPATVGEREVCKMHRCSLIGLRTNPFFNSYRNQARRIDAVVKREVKKALKGSGK